MRQVVANVAKNAATVHGRADIPIVAEDGLGKFPEWSCKNDKQCGGHDQSVLVHGQVVVNSMQQKVHGNENSVVRKVAIILVSGLI